MSKVYVRNHKDMLIKKIFKIQTEPKGKIKETVQPLPNWEVIRNELGADSLLSSSKEASVEVDETIRLYSRHKDGVHNSQKFDSSSVPAKGSTSVLIQACEQGNSVEVKNMLDGGLDVHARSTDVLYSGFTAVHVAALYGHINVVETLLNHAAKLDEEDTTGKRQPLHFAAASRQRSMVRFLLKHGAQVDAKARNAVQPIHEASWSGSIEVLDALIEAGAMVDCSDIFGYQPLHWATMTASQPEVIRYLSRRGADIEAKASDGSRPLQLACTSDPTSLRTLIALGAKTHYEDGSESAFEIATKRQSMWALEVLREDGADPNHEDDDGKTFLAI